MTRVWYFLLNGSIIWERLHDLVPFDFVFGWRSIPRAFPRVFVVKSWCSRPRFLFFFGNCNQIELFLTLFSVFATPSVFPRANSSPFSRLFRAEGFLKWILSNAAPMAEGSFQCSPPKVYFQGRNWVHFLDSPGLRDFFREFYSTWPERPCAAGVSTTPSVFPRANSSPFFGLSRDEGLFSGILPNAAQGVSTTPSVFPRARSSRAEGIS